MAALGTLALMLRPRRRLAHAAVLQQVQSGTAVNTADGIQTITISSIDITKSFLVFQTRSSGDRPVNSILRGRIASATTIQFERETNEGAPLAINIQWYVATFRLRCVRTARRRRRCRRSRSTSGLPAVASMNQAFVLWSLTPNPTENEFGGDDIIAGDLTSTTNLQFRTNDPSGHVVWWQVVEFTDPADINVQRGTVDGDDRRGDDRRPRRWRRPWTPARTFVLAGFENRRRGTRRRRPAAAQRSSRTPRPSRSIAATPDRPDNMPEISWQAVELRDGSMVTRGSAAFAAGVSQAMVPFAGRVNTTRAIAFASGQAGGQSMGRTPLRGQRRYGRGHGDGGALADAADAQSRTARSTPPTSAGS